jgi:FixJ family two-component response regulator
LVRNKLCGVDVVVVDDDASVRKALLRLLTAFGYCAVALPSARDLLDSNYANTVPCLVLDVELPEMDGFELQQVLRESGSPCTIVFVTAHDREDGRARALEHGAIGYLIKPFDDEDLFAVIRSVVSPGGH